MIILAVSYDLVSLNARIKTLSDAGHFVLPASSREAALARMRECRVDVLLMGATVPVADWENLMTTARILNERCRVVVVCPTTPPLNVDVTVEPYNEPALVDAINRERQRNGSGLYFSQRA